MSELSAPGKILVVDDSFQSRMILTKRLRAAGHTVEAAADGRQGLGAIRRFHPDVMITDWAMPEMDGLRLVHTLRTAREPAENLYIILLSAHDETGHRVIALDAGADDYLAKPWEDAELMARVRVGLRRQRMHAALAQAERAAALHTVAATVAHAIKNPLTALSDRLQTARSSPPSGPTFVEFLDRCDAEVAAIADRIAALQGLKEPPLTEHPEDTTMLDLRAAVPAPRR